MAFSTTDIDALHAALADHAGTEREKRVRLLLSLAEHPERSAAAAGRVLGIPRRTASRWVRVYREEGLDALLRLQTRESPEPEPGPPPPRPDGEARLLALITQIPTSHDTREWGVALGRALAEYLGDVDHVVVNIRRTVELVRPEEDTGGIVYYQDYDHATARTKIRMGRTREEVGWRALYATAATHGFPVDRFQEPIGFDYYYQAPQARLGSLLLFRRIGLPPISQETVQRMEALRPFVVYILSDHVARLRLEQPVDAAWRGQLQRIAGDVPLTERERQVLTLLVGGYTRGEIADSLHISRRTVVSHIQHIYRKLGVSSLREIHALYTTPRLPDGP